MSSLTHAVERIANLFTLSKRSGEAGFAEEEEVLAYQCHRWEIIATAAGLGIKLRDPELTATGVSMENAYD